MNNRKILALTKYGRRGASSRVRFWSLIPSLERMGWSIDVIPLLTDEDLLRFYKEGKRSFLGFAVGYWRRVLSVRRASASSILWFEKELLYGIPHGIERAIVPVISRTVIDYDDAVYLNYRDSSIGVLGRSAKFEYYAKHSACVTVGSSAIRKQMEAWGSRNCRLIPSVVDVNRYRIHTDGSNECITIGWIGTPVTVRFLDELSEVFLRLSREFSICVHVVGAHWSCGDVRVRCIEWTEESECECVSKFDIGVMPLVDGEWERAKCGYKLIQYMAAGVVPVGADVGENRILIAEGETGFLAASPHEWYAKLKIVCSNSLLRRKIGRSARSVAEERYNIPCAVQSLNEVFLQASTAVVSKSLQ